MSNSETAVDDRQAGILMLTSEIVAAYVGHNSVPAGGLPALILAVHGAVSVCALGTDGIVAGPEIEKPTADQIRKSVTPDGLISFIDGKTYKTLRRHLGVHGLTPEGYRARYGLGADYPIVAASYSEARSKLAKNIGLGVPGRLSVVTDASAQAA